MLSEDTATGKHINDYLIIDTLSSSPTSSVYRAEDTRLKNSTVTLKLLHTMHLSEQRHQQFLKEVHILKKLKHDHILPILDVGIYENMPYLVTGYAPGGSLRDRVPPQAAHVLSLQEILNILSQVGQALQYAHRMNIIHGNLKPENILFNAENGVLLTDFSLVTTMDAFSTDHSHHANTFSYMAPEQFQGWMTEESDQYALGCIAYELFTGQVPFLASDFSEIKHKHVTEKPLAPTQRNLLLPITIEEAILKAMEKKSEDRYPGVKDFVTSLSTSIPGHASKLSRADTAIPSSPTSFDQPTSVTGISRDAEPELAGTGKRTEESNFLQEEVSNLQTNAISAPQTQNVKNEQGALFLGSPLRVAPGTPTQAKLASRVPPSFNSPTGGAHSRDRNSFYKNPWLIVVSLFVVIVVITLGLLHFALPALLSSKSSPATISQNPLSTSTVIPLPTATPTNTPVLASKPAPTATPSPTPIPTPSSTPTPSPTSTTLIVTPASFHAESDCQKSAGSYTCTSTLQLPQNHQGNLKWVASGGNLATFFNPPRGALTPGQQQQVTIYVFNSCPHKGTINFSTKEGEVTVPWTC